MKFKILAGIVVSIQLFSGCQPVHPPPPMGPCTFTIPAPNNYDCYLNKAGTGRKINLSINLITRYAREGNTGPRMITQSDKTVSFDAATQSFPITIIADIPDPGYPWECVVNIEGTECSTCASGYSDPRESPNGACFANLVPNVSPAQYRAAKPRWQGGISSNSYSTAVTILPANRVPNVPNSCSCTTP